MYLTKEVEEFIESLFKEYQEHSNEVEVLAYSGRLQGAIELLHLLEYDVTEYLERFKSLSDLRQMGLLNESNH